jgi:sarcosine oxidase subunit gamma
MSFSVTFREAPRRPRFGCKGPLAEAWLHERGFDVPQPANSWVHSDDGVLVARLATSEFLVEALQGVAPRMTGAVQTLQDPAARRIGLYPVLREDYVFELAGARANQALLETCNVNFAPLAAAAQASAGPLIMTMMIGVGATIIVRPAAQDRSYTIWCDPSFGHYLQSTFENIIKQLEDPI